ncbi:hypothetical protein KQX54_012848 [Cotesia glomerata]|uniref:Uncharacterized protein n=1 Tax=Cotesia glomerata TaxID=32391 RepID=A0AAV7IYW8_COTGL|nr:hypothetical protein KQX54_012848 [Cotesia glomerata]
MTYCWAIVSMNTIGPFPKSKNGNTHALPVYYINKNLSNKAEGYSVALAPKYLGPSYGSKILSPQVVEISDEHGKLIGKYHAKDLRVRRSPKLNKEDDNQEKEGSGIID